MFWKSLAMSVVLGAALVAGAQAQQAVTLSVSVRNHRFEPAQLSAPANTPIVINVKNLDSTQMEFESVSLRVEKVVAGNGQASVRIRPLAPGRYEFYDDFNQQAEGALVVH